MEAEVYQDHCRRSTHACCAMDVYLPFFYRDELIELFSTFNQLLLEVLGVEIVYWIVDRSYASRLIIADHLVPVDSSVLKVNLGLHVEDCRDPPFSQCVCVFLDLRVRAYEYALISNLVEVEPSYEVGVLLLYMTIDDKDLVAIRPSTASQLAKLAPVS
jgi:hypothetical protein